MNALRNIVIGGVVLAVIVGAGWMIVTVVPWIWNCFWGFVGSLVDTLFSPDAMRFYARLAVLCVLIFVAWLIGRAIRRR